MPVVIKYVTTVQWTDTAKSIKSFYLLVCTNDRYVRVEAIRHGISDAKTQATNKWNHIFE